MASLKITSSLKAILEESDEALDLNSCGIQNQLCNGILLSKGTKKLLLDLSTNVYTIIFFARALSITWVDDPRYWRWTRITSGGNSFEVAELIQVSFLNISGKIQASKLLPGIRYQVVFEILIKNGASGWQLPVNLRLNVPNQGPQEHQVSLTTFPSEQWVEISVGIFILSEADCACGDVEFCLFEHGGHWKRGLLVKSATIRQSLLRPLACEN